MLNEFPMGELKFGSTTLILYGFSRPSSVSAS